MSRTDLIIAAASYDVAAADAILHGGYAECPDTPGLVMDVEMLRYAADRL